MESPYANFYAQNLEQSTVPVSTGKQFVQENVDRKQAIDQEIGLAAERYANEKGVGIADAKELMKARYENMINSEKAKVALETRDLKAQSSLSQAQIELANINPTDENAVARHNEIASKYAPMLAGTTHFDSFSRDLKTQQMEALRFQRESRLKEEEQATAASRTASLERLSKAEAAKAASLTPQSIEEREAAKARGRASVVVPSQQISALKARKKELIPEGLNEADLFYPVANVNEKKKRVDPTSKDATHFEFAVKGKDKKPITKPKDQIKKAQEEVKSINAKLDELEKGFGSVAFEVGNDSESEAQTPSQPAMLSGSILDQFPEK